MTAQEAYQNACRESSLAYEALHAALPARLQELVQREATAWFSYKKQSTVTQDLLYGIVAPEGQVPFDLDQYLAALTLLQTAHTAMLNATLQRYRSLGTQRLRMQEFDNK